MKKLFLGLLTVISFTSFSFADNNNGPLDRDHRHEHEGYKCWAENHRGRIFEGRGRREHEAREEALERCREHSRRDYDRDYDRDDRDHERRCHIRDCDRR